MTNQAGRLRDAAVFLFVAVYFLWFTADGLRAYLSYDDLMNLYCAWILPVKTIIAGNFLAPTVCERPLGTAFYRGIYALFGFSAFPFRAAAFALLLVNIWLTYQTARRLTNSAEAGAVTALLAAVHSRFAPLYYDTGVIYDVMSYTFYFAALLVYIRVRGEDRLLGMRHMVYLGLLYTCAVNSKEIALTLPISLLAYELVFHRPAIRSAPQAWRWSWREARGVWLSGIITLWFLAGKFFGPSLLVGLAGYRLTFTWERFMGSWRHFLDSLFHRFDWFTPSAVIAVWLLSLAVACLARTKSALWAWFFVMFSGLPVVFIPIRDAHSYYIPLFGWALLAAVALYKIAERIPTRLPGALLVTVALALTPLHRDMKLFSWLDSAHPDCTTATIVRQLHALHPSFKHGSRLLFVNDPVLVLTSYQIMYMVRLSYNDMSLVVQRRKLGSADGGDDGKPHDYVFDWQDDRLIELPAR